MSIARKNGKALSLDTEIPTPHGWTTMGDLKVGDKIYDDAGAVCRVTFATPVQFDRECFWVHFADGTRILADADHQWTVYSRSRHGRKVTLTTAQMKGDVVLPYTRASHVERNYSVDVAGPVECSAADLPVAPYTFGAWLGDGKSDAARIYVHDDDCAIIDNILGDGFPVRKGRAAFEWLISDGVKDRTKDCLQSRLRKMGVLNAKRIPPVYLRASIPQRLALLQGLMDTDGHASKRGQCEFVTVERGLAADVIELIRSLGHKATLTEDRARLNGKDCGPRFRIQFWAFSDFPCFRLPRKKERLKERASRSRNGRNYITAIEPTDSVPVRCIQVDSPSSLFLAGKGFTPTHNTALIAALCLAHLVGPEAVQNGEIYSAANDREQAAQVFKVARQIVEADPELAKLIRVVPSTKTLACPSNGSFYRAISAEAGTKHGFNPTVVIYDELAQAKSRELYDVLDTSFGARAEPLFVTISTQSNDPEHILSKLIDDGLSGQDPTIVVHLYAVPEECEDIFDPKAWKLANPALGDFRSLADMQALADKAQRMPAEEPKFRNLFLNQRVAPVSSLISRAEWTACAGEPQFNAGDEVYLALDLSSTTDLTALVMVGAGDETPVKAWFWKPADLIAEHSARDFGSGNRRYQEWRDAGWLEVTPGRSIDHSVIAARIAEICNTYAVKGMAYDRWRMNDLLRQFDGVGLQAYAEGQEGDGLRLIPWGQGFKDMAPAIDALELAVMERKLVHPASPVLTWNVANAVAVVDPAGNRKLDKGKARFRIDGAVALAMACGLKTRDRTEPPVISVYDLIARERQAGTGA